MVCWRYSQCVEDTSGDTKLFLYWFSVMNWYLWGRVWCHVTTYVNLHTKHWNYNLKTIITVISEYRIGILACEDIHSDISNSVCYMRLSFTTDCPISLHCHFCYTICEPHLHWDDQKWNPFSMYDYEHPFIRVFLCQATFMVMQNTKIVQSGASTEDHGLGWKKEK